MPDCARCGAEGVEPPNEYWDSYVYCDDCRAIIEDAKENGVVVRSRHGNRLSDEVPYEVTVNVDGIKNPHTVNSSNRPRNQVEALAMGKKIMRKHDLPGVFIYQKSGSEWLLEEYLEAHPGIAEDVENENKGFLSRLFGN